MKNAKKILTLISMTMLLFACLLLKPTVVHADDTKKEWLMVGVDEETRYGKVGLSYSESEGPENWSMISTLCVQLETNTVIYAYAKPNYGYNFVRWDIKSSNYYGHLNIEKTSTDNPARIFISYVKDDYYADYVAVFEPQQFNVRFYKRLKFDDSPVVYSEDIELRQSVTYLNSAEEPTMTESHEGWTFEGWYWDTSFQTKYDFSESVMREIDLYPKWVKNTYTVKCLMKSGIKYSLIYDEQTVTHGEKAVKPADPTKDGYVFEGWYTDSNFKNKFNFDTPITGDISLYPHFVEASSNVSDIFTDVSDSAWFHDAVQYVYDNGIMTGKTTTTFDPTGEIKRAQFALILYRLSGQPAVTFTNKFPDVPAGTWYSDAVIWASNVGVVTGYLSTGTFGPTNPITREQMALMMFRYANYCKYDTSARASFTSFTDASSVSSYAKEAMQWAVAKGIITGKQNGTALEPQGKAKRAECATIIMRFMEAYK